MASDGISSVSSQSARTSAYKTPQRNDKTESRKKDDPFARARGREAEEASKREVKRENKKVDENKEPATPVPPAVNTTPVEKPEPVKTSSGKSIDELAKQYVAEYEEQSGHKLTEEERSAKIKDVASFYSEPSRADRLENLVSALA